MTGEIPYCPWILCVGTVEHFHELAAAPLSTPYTYPCKCVEEDDGNIIAEHFEGSLSWSRCYRPRPSCMGCGNPAVMLTDRLCAPCFDAAWDAQIDAEADRLAGPKVVATS